MSQQGLIFNEKPTEEEERIITQQYKHIKSLALLKYDAEEKREQGLLQQASQMQTAFSFMTAAVFMAVPICIEYRGLINLNFFLICVSVIIGFLLLSLVFASVAQWRWKTSTFPDIAEIKKSVIDSPEWEKLCVEYHQIDQWVNLVSDVQKEKTKLNDRRVILVMISMICFYMAILVVAVSFVIGVMILTGGNNNV